MKFERHWWIILLGFFLLALVPRIYGAENWGKDYDGPGTFNLINFDEGGSCRAVLADFKYPTFLGQQILAIAKLQDHDPAAAPYHSIKAKAYCGSRPLLRIQRMYSAVAGSLTVVLIGLLALFLRPQRPQIAWTACALLALSNFHVAESHSGTADAPQVFFIYLLTAVLACGLAARKRWVLLLSPIFLIFAIWTKWYFFSVFAYAALLPQLNLERRWPLYIGIAATGLIVVVTAIGFDTLGNAIAERAPTFLWGRDTSKFGTGYGHIGSWRRWIRNATNLPLVHIMALGLPACVFVWGGIKQALADHRNRQLWLLFMPAVVYAAYMLLIGPVTYYRHYLPLVPTVTLLAALGLWESNWANRRWFLVLFFLYPALLTLDSEYNYRFDPRRELRPWYSAHPGARTMISYYVVPPSNIRNVYSFQPDYYLQYGDRYLATADYVILSENWYDTSFPNELNGPVAWNPEWLIKTKPEYVRMYRRILSGQDPNLELDAEFNLRHFMPEFLIHRAVYGSFQLFIGDLRIYRVISGQR